MGSDIKAAGLSMTRIGELLKEAREKKAVTIDQVQKQTRINSTVLKALEDGRCDGMLTATYVKSFLKKYAEYLGLDARQILTEYAKLRPATTAQQVPLSGKAGSVKPADMSKYFQSVKFVVVAAIAIALVAFVFGKTQRFVKNLKERKTVSSVKGSPGSGVAVVTSKKKAPYRASAVRKESAPKDKLVAKAISNKAPAAAADAQNNISSQRNAQISSVSEKQSDRAFQRNAQIYPIPKTTQIKLLLRANQTVLVKLRTDGNLLFSRVLPPGTVESFTAEDRINIYVAKAEAIELYLNGRGLGYIGKGLIKNIEITRSGLKIK